MASLVSTLSIAYIMTPNALYPRYIQHNSGALLGPAEFNLTAETLTLPYGGLQLNKKSAQAETKLQPPVTGEVCASADPHGLISDGGVMSFIDSPGIKRRNNYDRLRAG